jgi:hypothetical protein
VHYASAGLYLDGKNSNCRFENNVVFGATKALNINDPGCDNQWINNTFLEQGTPPKEVLDAIQAKVGLEPSYRQLSVKTPSSADGKAATRTTPIRRAN